VQVRTSKRNPALSEQWFRKRIHRLRENAEFKCEVDAIIALRTGVWREQYWWEQGWKKEDWEKEEIHLRDELTHFACLAVSPHQGRPAILERVWASKTGKPWKTLKDFPRQLEEMAEEVKRINRGDRLFFARRRHNDLDRREQQILGRNCRQLPDMMRSYAAALKERNAAVATATPRGGRFVAIRNLSEVVKLLTGTDHDKEVAHLLTVAARALREEYRFDALSIAQVRYRRKGRPQT
jgi:hypothetical protein